MCYMLYVIRYMFYVLFHFSDKDANYKEFKGSGSDGKKSLERLFDCRFKPPNAKSTAPDRFYT